MNILYCGDQNILDGVLISVLSLLKHVREPLRIYLLTGTIETPDRVFHPLPRAFSDFLDRLLKAHDPQSFARLFDITKSVQAQPPTANLGTRFTPCCMLRLYADLIDELPEKLLYLDNDVICRQNPAAFYHQDMRRWELAGCLDHYGSWFFRKKALKRDYVNSGVLLLNLTAIRATGLFARCRRLCRDEQMFMPDQSALNRLAIRKKLCPRKYNEQRTLRPDTVFQHFTTSFRFFPYFHTVSVKPWNVQGMHETLHLHEYDDILAQYRKTKEHYTKKELPV